MLSVDEIVVLLQVSLAEISFGRLSADDVDPDASIAEDLGFDSLDYATAMLEVDDRLQAGLAERAIDWSAVDTVRKLAELFATHQASSP